MAGHRPSNLCPLPGISGDSPGGPVPVRLDTPTWVGTQSCPGSLVIWPEVVPTIGPGICPGPKVWGVPLGHPSYELWGQVAHSRLGAGEAGTHFWSSPEGTCVGPYFALRVIPNLALPEDISAIEKEVKQLANELREKRLTLGYSQADVGLAVGALCGKVLSQTTICRFEAQQLSLANMWKLQPLLKKWLQEVDEKNLLGLCKMEMILQQSRKRRCVRREKRIRNHLERFFLQCPKPTAQQISRLAGHLRLQQDVVRVWFLNRSRMGSGPSSEALAQEAVVAARPPFPVPPVGFPLCPGLHFELPLSGGCCLTPLYSPGPVPTGMALLPAPLATVGLPRLSN